MHFPDTAPRVTISNHAARSLSLSLSLFLFYASRNRRVNRVVRPLYFRAFMIYARAYPLGRIISLVKSIYLPAVTVKRASLRRPRRKQFAHRCHAWIFVTRRRLGRSLSCRWLDDRSFNAEGCNIDKREIKQEAGGSVAESQLENAFAVRKSQASRCSRTLAKQSMIQDDAQRASDE